jgi:hypothetical protein
MGRTVLHINKRTEMKHTDQTVFAAYNAVKKMAKDFADQYYVNATETERASKYFDIGYGDYYGSPDHLALLAKCGFNSVDEYNEAVEKTSWSVAYDNFNKVTKLLGYKSPEYQAIKQDLIDSEMYDEEDHRVDGKIFWEIAKQNAPKQAQLVELTAELGLDWPFNWG